MSAPSMNRDQWIEVFQATGLDEEAMRRWHCEFESRYPAQHQSFLEWIGFSPEDALSVRKLSTVG